MFIESAKAVVTISFGPINPIPFPALKQLIFFSDELQVNWLPYSGTLLYEKSKNRSLTTFESNSILSIELILQVFMVQFL